MCDSDSERSRNRSNLDPADRAIILAQLAQSEVTPPFAIPTVTSLTLHPLDLKIMGDIKRYSFKANP